MHSILAIYLAAIICSFCYNGGLANDVLTVTPAPETCEQIDFDIVQYCIALEGYKANETLTSLPNDREHTTQQEAFNELATFKMAIQSKCSGGILDFLCSYYVPICYEGTSQTLVLKPCRSLCETVYNDCLDDLENDTAVFNLLGGKWPDHFNCSLFSETQCFGPTDPSNLTLPGYIPGIGFLPTDPPAPAPAPPSISTRPAAPSTATSSSTSRSVIVATAMPPVAPVTTRTTAPKPTATNRPVPSSTPEVNRNTSGASSHTMAASLSLIAVLNTLLIVLLLSVS